MPAYRNKTGSNRGKSHHGKGWRDPYGGSLYFQLKRDSCSRQHEVSPQVTMDHLIDDLERDVVSDYPNLDEGLEFAFFLRKQRLERSHDRAFSIFDGGETVYVKVVDDEGTEYVQHYTPGEGCWQVKRRGTKPKVEDVIATYGIGEAFRLGLLK